MRTLASAALRASVLSSALAALYVQIASAQVAPTQMDRVVVTASPFKDQDELQAVQPSVVIGKDALSRDRAASLGDTLTNQAGIQSSSFGPGASRPVIRGLDGPRIKTAENGVGTMDVGSISPDHAVSAEVLGARQIEILRGPATLLYGSGAIGGLVNVVTDRIPQMHTDGTRILGDARFSTAERARDTGVQLRSSANALAFTGEYADRRTDDFDTARQRRLANSDTATKHASLGSSYILNNGFVGIGVNRFESKYGIPSEEGPRIALKRDRIELQGELNSTAALERVRFSAASSNYQHAEIEASGEVGTVFRHKATSARVDLQTKSFAGWRTVLGADTEQGRFSANGEETIVPQTSTRAQAVFAVSERTLGPGRVEIGARIERVKHSPDADPAADRPGRKFSLGSGSVAYQYPLSTTSAVTASFTHAERAPAIEELYSNGAHLATLTYDLGDPRLSKERSQNFDLSYKLQSGAWSVRASVYRNTFSNFIYGAAVDENNDGVSDLVNDDGEIAPDATLLKRAYRNVNARFTGAELTASYAPAQGFGFTSMADTVRGIITGSNHANLPRISPSRISGKLTWRSGSWYADGGATHAFKQNHTATFETATPGYTRIDASLRYRRAYAGNRSMDIYLLGKNLGNRDMRVHTSFLKDFAPLPGRSAFVGLTVSH